MGQIMGNAWGMHEECMGMHVESMGNAFGMTMFSSKMLRHLAKL
jgi:hypothetical protein